MTQVSDIITDAFRESNLIAVNTSPTPAETTEGLNRLQAIIQSTLGNEVGYIMEDWNVVSAASISNPSNVPLTAGQLSSYFVKPQSRLICNLSGNATLDLDPLPQDGQRVSVVNVGANTLTLDGNGRLIAGGTTDTVLTTARAEYFYRSDLAEWVEILTFTTSDELPFPADFDDYFITALAMRLNPRYGRPLPPEAAARFDQQRLQIIDRYSQSRVKGIAMEKKTGGVMGQ